MSALIKRSFCLSGHRTSIALEEEFWQLLDEMAKPHTLTTLITMLDEQRAPSHPLASSLRVAALKYVLAKSPSPPG